MQFIDELVFYFHFILIISVKEYPSTLNFKELGKNNFKSYCK